LEDEEVSDHLLAVFAPDDSLGPDGQVHEEGELRVCSCGFSAAFGAQLDAHFLTVFTPDDRLDPDGTRHHVTANLLTLDDVCQKVHKKYRHKHVHKV
jgi:hypothetical protein